MMIESIGREYGMMKCSKCGMEKEYPLKIINANRGGMGQGDRLYECICNQCGIIIKDDDVNHWMTSAGHRKKVTWK
jgi:hypothetical protein